MKNFAKRIISLLCVLSMLFSTLIAVQASSAIKLTAGSIVVAKGTGTETVDVPITISNNTGIIGMTLTINYGEGLSLTNIKKGDAFTLLTMTKSGNLSANPVKVTWDGEGENDYGNGTAVILSFTVPKDIEKEYPIEISVSGAIDENINPVAISPENGGITVAGQTHIHSSGVSLNKTTANMTVGDSVTLTATVAPSNATNKSVTWKSSNTAVATVSNGVVKAVKAGNATITVTTVDGGKTASCAVTVVNPVVAVIIDSIETNYGSFTEAVNAANSAGKAVELKVLENLDSASIESEYKHIIDLNSNTVNELNVTGEVVIKNGTVNTLNVTGIVVTENVTVGNTNAVCSGTEGTKSVYTSYALGVRMVNGAQVRIGGGLTEDGVIDSKSGLRFIAECDRNDTFVNKVLDSHYTNNTYDEGYGIGIAIGAEDSEAVVYIPAKKWQDADQSVFTAAITALSSSNFNRRFTARAYVEYDGLKLYTSESSTRSMYQVAAGLIKNESLAVNLIDVLNMYVNQTGVRLTFTAADGFSARMTGSGAYTGEAFFTLGETMCEEGIYMVNITPVGSAKIDVDLFNQYVRINNNNSVIKPAVSIKDNENGTYTISFDYSSVK